LMSANRKSNKFCGVFPKRNRFQFFRRRSED
jgi:hypothetical protein